MKTPLYFAALTLALPVTAADWAQWRGPNRDGHVDATIAALPKEPKALWSISVGNGQASPVVAGGKLIYLDEQKDQEVAHCVDLKTGKELWQTPCGESEAFENTYGTGPRCTPLVDGDRVYVQTCRGSFRCLALADGKASAPLARACRHCGAPLLEGENDDDCSTAIGNAGPRLHEQPRRFRAD